MKGKMGQRVLAESGRPKAKNSLSPSKIAKFLQRAELPLV